jgi:hypothetical protein
MIGCADSLSGNANNGGRNYRISVDSVEAAAALHTERG